MAASVLLRAQGPLSEVDNEINEKLDSAVVLSSRAGESTPVTFTMMNSKELKSAAPLKSLPMTLALQPSVVSVNEGGTGLGYSKLTVRGSKGSQINVTLNGITLNDPESQEVFWVNIPSLNSMLSSVQLQRGLGTVANGAGSFGASINMSTNAVHSEPYGSFEYARGAWNTSMTTVSAGTGRFANGFYADFTYSKNTTDGYIRNAWADVQSAMAVVGWIGERNSLKLTYLMGKQHTGITWEGIPLAMIDKDRRYNPAGEYYDALGNVHYYGNESDNYLQQHVQLTYTHLFGEKWFWNTTLNYTDGLGFTESYKTGKELTAYGFDSPVVIDGVEYKKGDFVTQKYLNNSYYVLNTNLRYDGGRLKAVAGLSGYIYDGAHYGDIIWSNLLGGDIENPTHWYENSGLKKEISAYLRGEYALSRSLTAYAELQYRLLSLDMKGLDDEFSDMAYSTKWPFFNPRAGITFAPGKGHKAYASVALGHREPGRSDIKEVIESNNAGAAKAELKPETMLDFELGYEYTSSKFAAGINLYAMEYWDMLLETGKLSDSGYAIKENVGRAWRRGVELSACWKIIEEFELFGNMTFSDNRIRNFTAYVTRYDNMDDWNVTGQIEEKYSNTPILMSPSLVGALGVNARPFAGVEKWKDLLITFSGKYVGRQYWDNTASADRSLPAYLVADASVSNDFTMPNGNVLRLGLYVNNLFNAKYCGDAWVNRAYFDAEQQNYQEEGLYPQAPISCMLKLTYSF